MRTRCKTTPDNGIKRYVEILRKGRVETYESCEGGTKHPYPEPTICFYGQIQEGFRALSVALDNGLPVKEIRQFWSIEDKQLALTGQLLFGGKTMLNYLSSSLQCLHLRFPPVPASSLRFSMLFPSVHLVLSWCTSESLACQGLVLAIFITPFLLGF